MMLNGDSVDQCGNFLLSLSSPILLFTIPHSFLHIWTTQNSLHFTIQNHSFRKICQLNNMNSIKQWNDCGFQLNRVFILIIEITIQNLFDFQVDFGKWYFICSIRFLMNCDNCVLYYCLNWFLLIFCVHMRGLFRSMYHLNRQKSFFGRNSQIRWITFWPENNMNRKKIVFYLFSRIHNRQQNNIGTQ